MSILVFKRRRTIEGFQKSDVVTVLHWFWKWLDKKSISYWRSQVKIEENTITSVINSNQIYSSFTLSRRSLLYWFCASYQQVTFFANSWAHLFFMQTGRNLSTVKLRNISRSRWSLVENLFSFFFVWKIIWEKSYEQILIM